MNTNRILKGKLFTDYDNNEDITMRQIMFIYSQVNIIENNNMSIETE